MVLAYDFPILGLFWTVLWAAFVFTIFFGVIWAFVDNFRRHDHGGVAKALWALFILCVPLFGMFVYILARPAEADYAMSVPSSTTTSASGPVAA